MIEITVEELVAATGATLVSGPTDRVCRGCAIDSRQVGPDGLFVAFKGERVDGNRFAASALEAGAACVCCTAEPDEAARAAAAASHAALVRVDDPEEFLLKLAAWYRGRLNANGTRVVGITGSIGKTTTKDALACMLASRYRVWKTQGNFNNLIGLPLTVLSAPADTEVLVLEMGMDGFGQIERLARCAAPSWAVITKVGTSHIGMLGSRENIARAKAEVVSGMRAASDGAAPMLFLGGEDDFTPFIERTFAAPADVAVVRCGAAASDAVRFSDVALDQEGHPSFTVRFGDGASAAPEDEARLTLPITGAQSVINVVYAAAIAHAMGVSAPEIAQAVAHMELTGRRQDIRRAACGARVIDDSYNASPESMAAALDLLCLLPCTGSRIALLGEMGELGEADGPRLHALVGAYAAAKKLDLIVFVGASGAREMADAARLMGASEERLMLVADVRELIDRCAGVLGTDDLVLVKASRFVGLDRFVEEVCSC